MCARARNTAGARATGEPHAGQGPVATTYRRRARAGIGCGEYAAGVAITFAGSTTTLEARNLPRPRRPGRGTDDRHRRTHRIPGDVVPDGRRRRCRSHAAARQAGLLIVRRKGAAVDTLYSDVSGREGFRLFNELTTLRRSHKARPK